ncbi:Uu.00g052450.m01.CDS01 [Anthostomella pinea]|uniref:Uu.00g052450.m01.CDS01 n=1 Tax=Anthostomella pinea TaxID=933095 RepID=A0AAI8YPH1_9PEZI|nr:Uu.00g052450.m01.CDS01 [Anthostomella pinea]
MACLGLKAFTARLQRLVGLNKSKAAPSEKRSLQISAPFNFKHETVCLPGISEDEIAILKEKAAASRLGVASDNGASSIGTPPRRAPAPPSQLRPAPPIVQVTPSTPISPAGDYI